MKVQKYNNNKWTSVLEYSKKPLPTLKCVGCVITNI